MNSHFAFGTILAPIAGETGCHQLSWATFSGFWRRMRVGGSESSARVPDRFGIIWHRGVPDTLDTFVGHEVCV
jgi:hypothetical protein